MSIFWKQSENTLQRCCRSETGELYRAYLCCNVLVYLKNDGAPYLLALYANKIPYRSVLAESVAVSLLEFENQVRSISLKIESEDIWFHQFFDDEIPSCITFSKKLSIENASELLDSPSELLPKCRDALLESGLHYLLNELFSENNFLSELDVHIFNFNHERRESMRNCIKNLKQIQGDYNGR